MTPITIVATGAVSSSGCGRAAYSVGSDGASPGTRVCDVEWLRRAGLRRPRAALVPWLNQRSGESDGADPAVQLLGSALSQLCRSLDVGRPGWRSERIGLSLGSSSGGLASQADAFERLERGEELPAALATCSPYFGPVRSLRRRLGIGEGPTAHLLGACASSTFAVGLGCRWIELELAELVIAGGYDALTLMVAAGFESLAATSATFPRAFCSDRDGLSLGEGAAVMALARPGANGRAPAFSVLGFGVTADAHHPTAPDPTGGGLCLAARRALLDSGLEAGDIRLVSAHGTATAYNDAAEMKVLRDLQLSDAVVHPLKAVIGHTLGAAGALEILSVRDAAERGLLPATVAAEPVEPGLAGRLLVANEAGSPTPALKLSAAFGGANAAVVLGYGGSGSVGKTYPVAVRSIGEPVAAPDIKRIVQSGACIEPDRVARLDVLSGLVLSAVAAQGPEAVGSADRERVGVVVGTSAATVEVNAAFESRRRRRGCSMVEPRRFPATTPNLAAGYVAMAYGWRGPNIAVGGGLAASLEALLVALDLVASGDAESCWLIVADDVGETVSRIWDAAGWPLPRVGALAVLLGRATERGPGRLDRSQFQTLFEAAENGLGSVLGAQPGWPTLHAALCRLDATHTHACRS